MPVPRFNGALVRQQSVPVPRFSGALVRQQSVFSGVLVRQQSEPDDPGQAGRKDPLFLRLQALLLICLVPRANPDGCVSGVPRDVPRDVPRYMPRDVPRDVFQGCTRDMPRISLSSSVHPHSLLGPHFPGPPCPGHSSAVRAALDTRPQRVREHLPGVRIELLLTCVWSHATLHTQVHRADRGLLWQRRDRHVL